MKRAIETELLQGFCPLPNFTFADSFSIELESKLSAREAAQRAFLYLPNWVNALMSLRNLLVTPFGLVRGKIDLKDHNDVIGIFPVLEENENSILLGLDDKHLDFRILIEISQKKGSQYSAQATTWVKTHNSLGRAYLFTIKPFHKIIVPLALEAI